MEVNCENATGIDSRFATALENANLYHLVLRDQIVTYTSLTYPQIVLCHLIKIFCPKVFYYCFYDPPIQNEKYIFL